jgi:hypothetical protein
MAETVGSEIHQSKRIEINGTILPAQTAFLLAEVK